MHVQYTQHGYILQYLGHFDKCLSNNFEDSISTSGVPHCGIAIYIKKYLKAKEELWKLKYFTMQKHNLQKNPLKETKILQDIITL